MDFEKILVTIRIDPFYSSHVTLLEFVIRRRYDFTFYLSLIYNILNFYAVDKNFKSLFLLFRGLYRYS